MPATVSNPFPAPAGLKVGIAHNVRDGLQPSNELRHRPEDMARLEFEQTATEGSRDSSCTELDEVASSRQRIADLQPETFFVHRHA